MKVTVEVNDKIVVTSVEEGKDPIYVVLMIGGQVKKVDGTDLIKAIEDANTQKILKTVL